jgi:hypothetical protein
LLILAKTSAASEPNFIVSGSKHLWSSFLVGIFYQLISHTLWAWAAIFELQVRIVCYATEQADQARRCCMRLMGEKKVLPFLTKWKDAADATAHGSGPLSRAAGAHFPRLFSF